jgi:hypothetical protein
VQILSYKTGVTHLAEVDCIDCMLKIMSNTAIHTDVTTLCNITCAEHLGILLMLEVIPVL